MIDFNAFQRSLVRIAAIAQEKLEGGADDEEDMLQEKLAEEHSLKYAQRQKKAQQNYGGN